MTGGSSRCSAAASITHTDQEAFLAFAQTVADADVFAAIRGADLLDVIAAHRSRQPVATI